VQTIRQLDLLRAGTAEFRAEGARIALVPTMGALHAGHVSLLEAARRENEHVVMSLFVNEAQFSSQDDFARYPRDEERDLELAENAGVDVVFAPTAHELYPSGFRTWVEPNEQGLEAEFRPGHFRAVATVCLKLFNIVRPQFAWFGRKDAQQVAVLKQLVRDLNVPVEIRVVGTVRDDDGLALSSRNARLSPAEREQARAIRRALETGDEAQARAVLAAAGVEPEYIAVADLDGPTLAIAARVGSTRLIDNVPLGEGENR